MVANNATEPFAHCRLWQLHHRALLLHRSAYLCSASAVSNEHEDDHYRPDHNNSDFNHDQDACSDNTC